jgi:drug/metabolite transporter (DMT)-like permease
VRLGLVALALIWGLNFPLVKLVLDGVPPLAFNALRFPVAAVVILGFLVLTGRSAARPFRRPERRDILPIVGLGILGNVGYQLLFIWGLDLTRAGNASLFLGTIPVWTALLAVAVGQESVSLRQWVGISGALGGAALLVLGGQGIALEGATLGGDLVMIGAAVSWAAFTVGSRPYIAKYGAIPYAAWSLWVGTPILVAVGMKDLLATDLVSLGWVAWAVVIYAGAFSISVAFVLWNVGVRLLGNAQTAIYQNAVPVVALVFSWPLIGEVPAGLQIVGAAIIVASVRITRKRIPVRDGRGAVPRESDTR